MAKGKEGVFSRIGKFGKEVIAELKKVVWLNRSELVKTTLTVIGFVLLVGAMIWAFDFLAKLIFDSFLKGTFNVN